LVSVGSGDRGTRATLPIGYDGPLPLRVQRGFLSDTTGWSIHGSALGPGGWVGPMVPRWYLWYGSHREPTYGTIPLYP
jgi:hypothetical protein